MSSLPALCHRSRVVHVGAVAEARSINRSSRRCSTQLVDELYVLLDDSVGCLSGTPKETSPASTAAGHWRGFASKSAQINTSCHVLVVVGWASRNPDLQDSWRRLPYDKPYGP